MGPLGISAASKSHWTAGDHVVLASDDTNIVWIDLEAKDMASARGALPHIGTQSAGPASSAPTWSHDGKTVVYTSSVAASAGRPGSDISSILPSDPGSTADLVSVPYNDKKGGALTSIAGASDPNKQEYYPAFSPDDAYLVFNVCDNGLSMYNQAQAEVYVIPSAGGQATRLRANDPPSCGGLPSSPGVTNSWPKWAPAVTKVADGRSFYWVVFSSRRYGTTPQLFLAGVVVDGKGKITTYASLYFWNQPSDEGNHTPAWEYFNVPPPPPPMGIPK
jgi:Tol biopolymer transport system component